MKRLLLLSFLGLMLLFSFSCRHNRLKTNEKELAKEIVVQENEKATAEKAAAARKNSQKDIKSSGGIRIKEDRSVDPQNPPLRIDIPGTSGNTHKLRLSDIATSVRYIKLQTPPDTLLLYDPFYYRDDLISTIKSDGHEILYKGLFGLIRFNMQGDYVQTIWKNNAGIEVKSKTVMWKPQDFYGVMPNNSVSMYGGSIYYEFTDGSSGNGQIMKFRTESSENLSVKSKPEIPGPGTIPGDTLFNTNIDPWKRFEWVYGIGDGMWTGINNEVNAGSSGTLLVTFNENGDTLCQFSDFERIVNFSKADYRVTASLANYYFNGLLTIKQEYNDTVFRLVSAGRILPTFILNWGNYKVTFMDGLDPDFDLSNKYILKSLHETNDYLFIMYSQNNDSPLNRKKNSVKFYNALFNKKERKLLCNPGFTSLPEGLTNDIDGGISFWPDFITPGGEMMKLISGKVLKDYVNSKEFNVADISAENRQKQKAMVSGLRNTDMVIMTVK